ncbi:hypothetical protein Tco_1062706, partial [Tanacetum coccineum]
FIKVAAFGVHAVNFLMLLQRLSPWSWFQDVIDTTSRYVVPTGRVKVPAGRYVVPTAKDNVTVSAGRSKVIPASRTILVLVKRVSAEEAQAPIVKERVCYGRTVIQQFLKRQGRFKAYIILNKQTMKVEESLNVTFDETPPPPKTSPLEDDELVEEEAIEALRIQDYDILKDLAWDLDHAGDYVDRKSTSGVCTFMGCCLTSWFSKKQTALAISTTEAEYVSAEKACQQALWMKQALVDYGVRLDDIPIMCDNK